MSTETTTMTCDLKPRTLARDLVRRDGVRHGWRVTQHDSQTDVFTRADEELVMVWTTAKPLEVANGFSYRLMSVDIAPQYDRTVYAIINARKVLAHEN